LKQDTDPIVLVSGGGNTGSGIQGDVEPMEISIVPAILVLAGRVGILVQNVFKSEVVVSYLGDLRLRIQPLSEKTYLSSAVPDDGCVCLIWDEMGGPDRNRRGIKSQISRRGNPWRFISDHRAS